MYTFANSIVLKAIIQLIILFYIHAYNYMYELKIYVPSVQCTPRCAPAVCSRRTSVNRGES